MIAVFSNMFLLPQESHFMMTGIVLFWICIPWRNLFWLQNCIFHWFASSDLWVLNQSSLLLCAQIIEECDTRFGENIKLLVETVSRLLSSPPSQLESDEGIGADKEEISDEHQKEVTDWKILFKSYQVS